MVHAPFKSRKYRHILGFQSQAGKTGWVLIITTAKAVLEFYEIHIKMNINHHGFYMG